MPYKKHTKLPDSIEFDGKTFNNLEWQTNANMNGWHVILESVYPEFKTEEDAEMYGMDNCACDGPAMVRVYQDGDVMITIKPFNS